MTSQNRRPTMKDNQAKYPQLRFKGFTDPWEERKLKELGDIQTGNTPPTSNLDNYSTDGVLWVTPTDIKTLVISDTAKKLSEVGVTKARIAKAGSILVTSIASIGKNTLVTMDAGFNQQINSLTPTPKNDSYFLLTQSEKWSEKMKKTAASATMQIVNKTDFSNISTFVPVHKEEQQKIGLFFRQLDNTITLHQRKLAKLKELKQGYLQKLFPRNGSKFPQLRFSGFADAWEQRKLGDIVVFLNGRAYKQGELLDSGKYPVLRVGNFNTNDKWYYSDLELPAKNYADKGDLLYTWATAFGPHIWKGPKVIYHYHIWKVETTSDISKKFAVHLLDADQAQMTNSLNGSTMVHITKGTMENKIVTIPGISEQRNMARLLDQLDCTIALHQRKLEKLQELKKGYLQKMFC
ncbi:restriction endonuclease subunit S [Levilactobacillus brevis]|uniref:Putative type-1 restriction enzyme MjaXP specificity protein n=2 Tax=Levilactobacillus brevis TaxID=1580 RepID=M5AIC7_LEVBR|nr:putative type-1 restriction enzyme MjaXP specificity protein [Levilactobacillus brevis KB290]